ncbi:hypothetical protein CEXT_17581 [Caerostris extrusa]|uniref:Uncharacterized protein n=1 Tax=Caerostris extrusa TaxID=172846 RepID=A0AAV4RQR7_CAEEX|nr:hypothetical protein CEXT_17581 [Caerostris extrusa]
MPDLVQSLQSLEINEQTLIIMHTDAFLYPTDMDESFDSDSIEGGSLRNFVFNNMSFKIKRHFKLLDFTTCRCNQLQTLPSNTSNCCFSKMVF